MVYSAKAFVHCHHISISQFCYLFLFSSICLHNSAVTVLTTIKGGREKKWKKDARRHAESVKEKSAKEDEWKTERVFVYRRNIMQLYSMLYVLYI